MSNSIYHRPSKTKVFVSGLLFAAVAFIPGTVAYIWRTGGL